MSRASDNKILVVSSSLAGQTIDTNKANKDCVVWDATQNKYIHEQRALVIHTHIISDITGLQTALDGKAALVHSHYSLTQPDGTNPFVYTDNAGKLHIDGDIIQSGSAYETHAEHVFTTDDYIVLRDGATAGLSVGAYAGFVAKKYDGVNDGHFVFDNAGTARVGDIGSEQPLTTRIETPGDTNIAIWDTANSRLNFIAQGAAFNKDFGTTAGTILEGRLFGDVVDYNTTNFLSYGGDQILDDLVNTENKFGLTMTSTPTGNYGSYLTFGEVGNPGYTTQMFNDLMYNELYFRAVDNGVPRDWNMIYHTGNFDPTTYELAFSKNTGFNLNLGSTAGTVLEGRTFGTAANSAIGDFIQNQNASAQSANMWISGVGRFGDEIQTNSSIQYTGMAGDTRYIYTNETNTGTGKLIFQAGGGSSAYGGALNLYANAHATHAGDVAIGLSANGTSKFRVNAGALDGGTDVFTVTNSGIGTFASTIQATTGKFTNLTDGYIPYHISDASGLGDSPIYTAAGYVRIGTQRIDNFKFAVQSELDNPFSGIGKRIATFTGNNTDLSGIQLGYTTDNGGIIAPATESGESNYLSFWTYWGGWAERMRLAQNGNVGIGYSTGTEITNNKLAVNGSGLFGTTTDGVVGVPVIAMRDYGTGILFKNTKSNNSNIRNWSINTDNQEYGDFDIKQSSVLGGTPDISRLYFGFGGNAVFSNTVNSTGYLLNGNNLFSSLTANKITQWDGTKFIPITDGTNGQVLTTNGSGVYSWTSTPYGGMYIYTLGAGGTTVTVASTDVWYEITTGSTGRTNNLVTFQNSHELKITVAGVYFISWSLAVGTLANQEVEGTVFINNTANTSFAGMSESMTANKSFSLSGNGHISLAVNDVVSLGVLNHTGANNITIDHLTLTMVKIGG